MKITLTIAALLLLVPMASAVGQTQLTCSTLQNQDVTVCDKTVRGSHIYTVEEHSSIGFSIKRVTAAKFSELVKTEKELMLVHAINDMRSSQARTELELQKIALEGCLATADKHERFVGSSAATEGHWEKITPVTFAQCSTAEHQRIHAMMETDTEKYEADLRNTDN